MALYVDTAKLEDAQWALALPPLVGLTCNPVLVADGLGSGQVTRSQYDDHLLALAASLPHNGRFFVQVPNGEAELMQLEGQRLAAMLSAGARRLAVTLKIPFTVAGLMATHHLSSSRVSVAVTGIFTAEQAFMAAASGADYVIPYLSRLAPDAAEAFATIEVMLEVLRVQAVECRLLVASVKTLAQLARLLRLNCDITAPAPLLRELFAHAGVREALQRFDQALVMG